MEDQKNNSKLNRIAECLKNKDYSNPELAGAKILSLLLICIVLLALLIFIVRIESIEIKGNVSVFNESEIVEASGVDVGSCMYFKPAFLIKRSIKKNIPMAENVKVRKNIFTNKITIEIEIAEYEFFVEHNGKYYGVDDELRVTDIRSSKLEFMSLGARVLKVPDIEAPVLGENLIFSETVDIKDESGKVIEEGKDEARFSYVTDMLGFLKDANYLNRVNAVLLDEKFNIRVVLDGKYFIYVGKCEGIATKFEVVEAIIKEGSTDLGKYVVINVQNPALASARVDNELDLSEYIIEEDREFGAQEGSSEVET